MKAGQWEALLDANGFGCRVRWAPNTAAPIGWVDRYEDDSEAGAGKLDLRVIEALSGKEHLHLELKA